MAKINITFNNTNYTIDESTLSSVVVELQSHLSTVMNGSGATIKFGGVSYNIDQTKLSAATNAFVTHLGKIAGSGSKVNVGGTEYAISSDKVATAVSDLEIVLGGLISEGGSEGGDSNYPDAGLYQTGAVKMYEEQGAEAIKDMLITPWDELVSSGAIVMNDGVMSAGMLMPENLPEKNEYGFYFGVAYFQDSFWRMTFYEDGSIETCDLYEDIIWKYPAGSATYGANSINILTDDGWEAVFQVSSDGLTLFDDYDSFESCRPALFDGDLIILNDGSVIALSDGLFALNSGLTGVTIPDSVTSIGDAVFSGCTGLTEITIPNSVTSIGGGVFEGCTSLTEITIPDSVNYIGDSAFIYCTGLTKVTIQDGVTSIGGGVFEGCTSLTEITIPDSVNYIGYGAFGGCERLNEVAIPDSVNPCEGALSGWPGLTEFIIPDGVTSIGEGAFSHCTGLTKVTIPNSVSCIYGYAFYNCASLSNIEFNGTVNEWKSVATYEEWDGLVPATYVQCSNGQVELRGVPT